MENLKLFLGPGKNLIRPFKVKSYRSTYTQQTIPFGYWYKEHPFQIVRPATNMEIYILSKYRLMRPLGEEE